MTNQSSDRSPYFVILYRSNNLAIANGYSTAESTIIAIIKSQPQRGATLRSLVPTGISPLWLDGADTYVGKCKNCVVELELMAVNFQVMFVLLNPGWSFCKSPELSLLLSRLAVRKSWVIYSQTLQIIQKAYWLPFYCTIVSSSVWEYRYLFGQNRFIAACKMSYDVPTVEQPKTWSKHESTILSKTSSKFYAAFTVRIPTLSSVWLLHVLCESGIYQ